MRPPLLQHCVVSSRHRWSFRFEAGGVIDTVRMVVDSAVLLMLVSNRVP
jgi:hypothetical protein